MESNNLKLSFDGEKVLNIFHQVRIKENIDFGPVVQYLGLESLAPNCILKKGTLAYYKIVDRKKYVLAKLKYGF